MKKRTDKILIFSFIIIIMASLLSYIFSGHREFSENENRYLAKKPKFTWSNLKSGKFTEDIEKYIDDQFILRDELIGIKTNILVALGRKDINNVYLGDKGYLIEKHLEKDFDYENLERNISYINSFLERNQDKYASILIAPTSGLVLEDYLPDYAPMVDQDKILNTIETKLAYGDFVNPSKILKKYKNGYVYFKTDHHWTSFGAYYSYCYWANKEIDLNKHKIEKLSDDFRGTLHSKLLWDGVEEDQIHVFDKDRRDYKIDYGSKNSPEYLYDLNKLDTKDQYQVFMGGNHPLVKIDTENKNGRQLIVFKDSFANAFVPFLLDDYESIHLVDLRYYKENINEYMEEEEISDILFLYNIINFAEDKSFSKLK